MKRIFSVALSAMLVLGAPAHALAVSEAAINAQLASIASAPTAESLVASYSALSEMINATTDPALLALIAAALTQVAEAAAAAGVASVQVAAAANAAAATAKANGEAVAEVVTSVAGTDGSTN